LGYLLARVGLLQYDVRELISVTAGVFYKKVWLKAGDEVTTEVEGLGQLTNVLC
jgi:2-keto-4-pentenoate hydratase/2-oxohepta-3-ene-1,7-dioic acid hydratase in catechol pathway